MLGNKESRVSSQTSRRSQNQSQSSSSLAKWMWMWMWMMTDWVRLQRQGSCADGTCLE